MAVTAKDGGCPVHVPPHEHAEGMNECWICDEPVPCGACGHTSHHTRYGCARNGCACKKFVKPPCLCPKPAPEQG